MPCVLFAATAGVGIRALGHGQPWPVTKPLVRMDDLTGKNGALSCHQEKAYHKISVLDMQDFDSVFVNDDINVHFECTRDDGKRQCYIPFGFHQECDHNQLLTILWSP